MRVTKNNYQECVVVFKPWFICNTSGMLTVGSVSYVP